MNQLYSETKSTHKGNVHVAVWIANPKDHSYDGGTLPALLHTWFSTYDRYDDHIRVFDETWTLITDAPWDKAKLTRLAITTIDDIVKACIREVDAEVADTPKREVRK